MKRFPLVPESAKRLLRLADAALTRRTACLSFRGAAWEMIRPFFWGGEARQEWFDEEIRPYFQALPPEARFRLVLDAGASTGMFSVAVAVLWPDARVVAFEPSPRQARLLRRNVALNGLSSRVEHVPAGLWDKPSRLVFRSNDSMSSIQGVGMLPEKLPFSEEVRVIRLDDWWQENGRPPVDLIKMDIEGAEIEALEGGKAMLSALRPTLLLQAYHLREGTRTLERCLPILSACGYEWSETALPGFVVAQGKRSGATSPRDAAQPARGD